MCPVVSHGILEEHAAEKVARETIPKPLVKAIEKALDNLRRSITTLEKAVAALSRGAATRKRKQCATRSKRRAARRLRKTDA